MEKLKLFLHQNKTSIICTIIPMVIFAIFFLGYYPGIIPYDGANQWNQVKSGLITNSHPFFSTYFILLLSKIHHTTTPIILFQMFMFSIIWGYFCGLVSKNSKHNVIIYIFTTVMCLLPIISIFAISLWKDILYSYYLFMISVLLYKGVINKFKYHTRDYILFGVLLTLICNYRHNGLYVVIMYLILLSIILFIKRKIITKKVLKNIGITILTFVILMVAISIPKHIYLNKSSKVIAKKEAKKGKKEIISLQNNYILWMMGEHIKDGNIKNTKDIKFLNNILEIKEWKKTYDPYIINSITQSEDINGKFVNQHKSKLMNIFIKYSTKYPLTIVKHYIKSDALIINPVPDKEAYVYVFAFSEWGFLGFDRITTPRIPYVRELYDKVINLSFKGALKWFYQPALIFYLSIIMLIVLSIKVYGRKIYLIATPVFLNSISLLPINLAQDLRYVYINYLVFFAILLLFILNFNKIFIKQKKKV